MVDKEEGEEKKALPRGVGAGSWDAKVDKVGPKFSVLILVEDVEPQAE